MTYCYLQIEYWYFAIEMPIPKIAPKSLASMTPSDLITHTVEGSPVSQKWLLCAKKNCNSILEKN